MSSAQSGHFKQNGFQWMWHIVLKLDLRCLSTQMSPSRRKFRSQTSDNMDRWKAEQGRGREKRKIRREKSRRERVRRKKIQMREKVGKSRNIFPMISGSGESKSRLAKAAGAEPAGQRDEKVHAVAAQSTFPSQNVQITPLSDHFWKLRCRKSARRCGAKHISKSKCTKHTIVGPLYKTHQVDQKHISKSKCTKHHMFAPLLEVRMLKKCTPLWREAHFQVKMHKTPHVRDHFWKLRCRKSARRCGAKHISKSKCTKHTRSGPLLAVEMSKKCTPLWREAHFQVKMHKTPHVRTTFGGSDVEKVHAVVARSTFRSQNVQSTRGSDHFWRFRCRFASLRVITLHYTLHTLQYITLHYTPQHYNYNYRTTQLHSTTLRYTPLH